MGLNGEAGLSLEWGAELRESKESGLNRESPERQLAGSTEVAESSPEWRQPPFLLASEAPQEEDETAALLSAAARKGCYDVAQQLLSQGTGAINSQDATGRTPLFWATEYRHERLVELLLSHGADPDVRDKALGFQGCLKRKVLRAGPSANSTEGLCPSDPMQEGNLCLHRAAHFGSPTIARMLLEAGSDLNTTNHLGNSPLHLAAQEKCHECLRDISRGFEQVAIPCLNMVDQESCPGDFLYITGNIVSGSALLPTKTWDQNPEKALLRESPQVTLENEPFSNPISKAMSPWLGPESPSGDHLASIFSLAVGWFCCRQMLVWFQPEGLYVTIPAGSTPAALIPCSTHLGKGCRCDGGCTMASCPCILRSQCSWTLTGGQLRLDTTGTAPEVGSIYECSMLCTCPRSCPNRVVQRGLRYFGELISNTEAAHREEDTYYFVVDMQDGRQCCLDGRYYGNVGRFLNHSCQPNLVALQVALGYEIPGIAFFSTRAIQAGEELG
ncbi:Histone-lysine N-methyltransferase EHMT1, partial [Ophiophagus hannah]